MANSQFNVNVRLLTAQFKKGMSGLQRQLSQFGDFAKSAFAVGGITAFAKQLVSVGSSFEDQMARVKAVSNATAEGFKMMQKEALRLGATTRFSASEAAAALENLTRNGLTAEQATKALEGTLQLAGANAISLAESADIVTNTMNAFRLSVQDVSHINDVLSKTCATSATNITDLYEAMTTAGPMAVIAGKSIEETAAALGTLANNGIKGSESGKALQAMYQRLSAITPKAAKAMQQFGIGIDEAFVKTHSLTEILDTLAASGVGQSVKGLSEIFGKNYGGTISLLINQHEELRAELDAVNDAGGTAARMFQQGIGATKNKIDNLTDTWEALLITLSQKSSGAINSAIGYVTHLIDDFNTVGGTIKNLALVVIPMFGKTIISVLTNARTAAIALKTTMKGLIGSAITLAIEGLIILIDSLTASTRKVNQEIKDADKEVEEAGIKALETQGKVEKLCNSIVSGDKKSLTSALTKAIELFPDFIQSLKDAADEADTTGNYDKFIEKLKTIATYQAKINANSALQKRQDAFTQSLGLSMYQNYADSTVGSIRKQAKSKGFSKEETKGIFNTLADYIIGSNSARESANLGKVFLENLDIKVSTADLEKYFTSARSFTSAVGGIKARQQIGSNENEIKQARDAEAQAAANAATNTQKKAEADQKAAESQAAAADKKKKATNTEESIQHSLETTLKNIDDDYGRNVISNIEKLQQLADAYETAYKSFRDLTGKTGAGNPYSPKAQSTRVNAQVAKEAFAPVKLDEEPLNIPDEEVDLSWLYEDIEKELEDTIQELSQTKWSEFVEGANEGQSAAESMANALGTLHSAFETLKDDDASWVEQLQALVSIMGVVNTVINACTNASNALQAAKAAEVSAETAAAAATATSATIQVAANTAVAGSGAAAATAAIPIVGPAIALVALAGILAAIGSSLPKFANGGIVSGSNYVGDNNLVRVNSGEMVLNKNQQSRLFDILDGKKAAPGTENVTFIIKGKDLVGAIRNYNNAQAKISSSL